MLGIKWQVVHSPVGSKPPNGPVVPCSGTWPTSPTDRGTLSRQATGNSTPSRQTTTDSEVPGRSPADSNGRATLSPISSVLSRGRFGNRTASGLVDQSDQKPQLTSQRSTLGFGLRSPGKSPSQKLDSGSGNLGPASPALPSGKSPAASPAKQDSIAPEFVAESPEQAQASRIVASGETASHPDSCTSSVPIVAQRAQAFRMVIQSKTACHSDACTSSDPIVAQQE